MNSSRQVREEQLAKAFEKFVPLLTSSKGKGGQR
jgi:hypothetical protein